MTATEFIQAAIEGKWITSGIVDREPNFVVYPDSTAYGIYYVRWDTFPAQPMKGKRIDIYSMVLDPKAWEAVGEAKNWKLQGDFDYQTSGDPEELSDDEWKTRMANMIPFLIDKGNVQQYIATLR